MAPSYKLLYFDMPGRADPIRILFTYGGIKFEDERFSFEDWLKYKPITPNGKLPVLSIDGEQIAESKAITRYVAKIVKLAGNNELEDLKIDSVVEYLTEFLEQVGLFYWTDDEEQKQKLYEAIINEHAPNYLNRMTALAQANGGYLALNRLTWADIVFVINLEVHINYLKKDIYADYPGLLAVKKNVLAVPAIKEFIKNRPPCAVYKYDLREDL